MPSILFISNNNLTDSGLSGGDRILIELIKGWKKNIKIGLLAAEEGIALLKKYVDDPLIETYCSSTKKKAKNLFSNSNYFYHALNRTFFGVLSLFKFRNSFNKYSYIYSASDFYPDTLPAFFIKLFNPKKTWIAGFYLFAPAPWSKDNPYKTSFSRFLTCVFYWLTQRLSYFLVYHFADYVFVTSKPDVNKFLNHKRKINHVIIIQGGVDITLSHLYLKEHPPALKKRKYLAVFMGRLHHQKGVLELIDIWKYVCKIQPKSKLAIIGNGQLLPDIKKKIKKLKLNNNIDLFGFLDGQKKYDIFKNSSIVVHPATYDSGGMAAAEAMAWGLPGVSFDLEALKTYYPKGMLKTRIGDKQSFSNNIIKLSTDSKLYSDKSKEAVDLIESVWSWDIRCQKIYNQVFTK